MSATPGLGQRFAAELVGTFIFVFVGAGSAYATVAIGGTDHAAGLLIAALANGIGLAIGISTTMAVSGGALNPAVTIGLWVGRKLPGRDVLPYIIAEVIGSSIAGILWIGLMPAGYPQDANYGAPTLNTVIISASQGIIIELVATFLLVLAVYGTVVDERAPKIAGFGVGLIVLVDVLAAGPFTGAAMNPARAIGPMIAGNFFPSYWYIYWVGPIIGGILAGLVYHNVLETKKKVAP